MLWQTDVCPELSSLAQDFVLGKLREIEGVSVAEPAGAFYVLPQMDAFFGVGVHAAGFGDVPDPDTLCRCAASARFWTPTCCAGATVKP